MMKVMDKLEQAKAELLDAKAHLRAAAKLIARRLSPQMRWVRREIRFIDSVIEDIRQKQRQPKRRGMIRIESDYIIGGRPGA